MCFIIYYDDIRVKTMIHLIGENDSENKIL